MRARQMPPAGMPRPSEQTYDEIVASLEAPLDRAATAHPNPGRTDTFRRLNRTEYRNAVRDLLALDIDVAALLPGDESSHGFDNVTVGDLSPTLLDRYVAAAEKISRVAVGLRCIRRVTGPWVAAKGRPQPVDGLGRPRPLRPAGLWRAPHGGCGRVQLPSSALV